LLGITTNSGQPTIDLTSDEPTAGTSNSSNYTPQHEVLITEYRSPQLTARFNHVIFAHALFHRFANAAAQAQAPPETTYEDLSGGYWDRRRKGAKSKKPEVLNLVESDDEVVTVPKEQDSEVPSSNSDHPNTTIKFGKCTVCLSDITDITSTVCGHIFCEGCILNAIKTQGKCPICRRPLTERGIHPIFL